jgi:hypothetical protein
MAKTLPSQTSEAPARGEDEPFQWAGKGHTEVCSHIGPRDYEDWSDYYEAVIDLLGHIKAIFVSLQVMAENSTGMQEAMVNLSHLGRDLAQEAIRRAERMHEEI